MSLSGAFIINNFTVLFVPRYKEERPHGMHIAEGRLRLRHLYGGDAQAPEVAPVVVRGVRILVARNHLWGHPIGSADKCVPEQVSRVLIVYGTGTGYKCYPKQYCGA
jgi:hypothetical protein